MDAGGGMNAGGFQMRKSVLLTVTAAGLAAGATAAYASGVEWQKGPKEGWFWYVDPPKEEEVKPEPKKEDPPPPPPVTVIQQQKPAEPAKPVMFSSAWIREEMPKLMDRAVDNPTPENVAAYLYVQKLAMMKSTAFTDSAKFVVAQTPDLDENARRPFSSFGVQAVAEVAKGNRQRVLREVAGIAGIWYFYRSDCPYCEKQGPVLEGLRNTYGYKVLPISLDGLPPPSGRFPNWVANNGQAEALSVTTTPTLVMVRPDTQDVLMISTGLTPLDEIQERILISAGGAGWISPDDYHTTKPFTDAAPTRDSEREYLEHVLRSLPRDGQPSVNLNNASSAYREAPKGVAP